MMSIAMDENSGKDPGLTVPPGSCDTHMHIYGPWEKYPLAPSSVFSPPLAVVDDYQAIQRRLGLERVVIIQPSGYGTDNSCTMDAVKTLGDGARSVVVVDKSVTDDELQRLTDLGACGIRFYMFPGGILSWDVLAELAERVHAFGWHVQLQMDGRYLAEREEALLRLPGNLVIDHVGKFMEPVKVDHPGFKSLLGIIDRGKCWVKLSAPYETSKDGPPLFRDVGVLAKALVKAAPERMLWASNWPHPLAHDEKPDDAVLLDLLLDWAEDDATRRRILVDNPAELYGFD